MVVSITYAKTHLSRLLREVEKGREVTITRRGVPIACIVAIAKEPQKVRNPR
jgi:prevent-host-death family protein